MTGGHWVAHPGGQEVKYKVNFRKSSDHPIIEGIDDFTVCTEQFYLHVDPAVEILATTRFPIAKGPHADNGEVDIPVIMVKRWGKGRVYYCSLGHKADEIKEEPVFTLIKRGLLWAAREI
jgi:type 1 glutamine amidotransferase